MKDNKIKLGMLLTPNEHMTGALLMNREIFQYLKGKIDVEKIIPQREDLLKIGFVGEVLYYSSATDVASNFSYIMGTSVATVGFLGINHVIQQFHSVDSVGLEIVLDHYKNSNKRESSIIKKWHQLLTKGSQIDTKTLQTRLMVYRAVEKFCCQNAKKIIVVSDLVRSQLVKHIEADASKIKVILNGLPDYWFNNNDQQFTHDAEVVFTTRSNSSFYTLLEKGQDRAFEILSRIKTKKIVYSYLSGLAAEHEKNYKKVMSNIDVELNLNLERKELKRRYRPGQIFLATSRTESFNLSLAEAMACKMVPVCFPTGLVLSHIEHGKNGFIVNSVKEAEKIINKLSKNFEIRERIGQAAYETAKKYFTYDRMLQDYESFLKSVIY